MKFEKAKYWGSIALLLTIFNIILLGLIFVDTLSNNIGDAIDYLLIICCFSIPMSLAIAIVSARLYKTTLAAVLICINAFLLIVPILFLYIVTKGFCVVC